MFLTRMRALVVGDAADWSKGRVSRRSRLGLMTLEGREVPSSVTASSLYDPDPGGPVEMGDDTTWTTPSGSDEAPAGQQWYNVRLLNPEHSSYDTQAEFIEGGLFLRGNLPNDDRGGVYVSAASEEDAVFKAVVGSFGVDVPPEYTWTADATYDFVWLQTHAGTGDERPPFLITADNIWLEDMAAFPDECDWDYNDWVWPVSVELAAPAAPVDWQPLTQAEFKTLMDKQGLVKIGSPNYDRTIGLVFQEYVGRNLPRDYSNSLAFPTGMAAPDPVTVTPDYAADRTTEVRNKLTGQFVTNVKLTKGTRGDAKLYKDNIGTDALRELIRGLDTHRLRNPNFTGRWGGGRVA